MDFLFDTFANPDSPLMMSVLVFAAATTLAFGMMAIARVRTDVKRRAAGINVDVTQTDGPASRSLRHASIKATQRLIDYANQHFSPSNEGDMRKVRKRLIQAGYLEPRADAFYFLARVVLAAVAALVSFVVAPLVLDTNSAYYWPLIWLGGIAGYLAPSL